MFPLGSSESIKIGFAPVISIACAVATWVMLGTITSSPLVNPLARHDKCSAAVQLDTVTAYFEFTYFENSLSNKDVYFPCVNQPLLKTSSTFLNTF